MTCVELNIALMADHPKRPPTMEPITIALCHDAGYFNQQTLGKATCKLAKPPINPEGFRF